MPAWGLAFGLFVSGCYLLHEPTGEEPHCGPPAGQVCCDRAGEPVRVDPVGCPFRCPSGSTLVPRASCGGGGADAGTMPPIDASAPPPTDAGTGLDGGALTCPARRADLTCLEAFVVEPGVPFELPVSFDACACCAEAQCRVESAGIELGEPTLRLRTGLCPDPCLCAACNQPQATCEVPPLDAGVWNVVVNDAPAFRLPVSDGVFERPPPTCVAYAEEDVCRRGDGPVDGTGWRPREVCAARRGGAPERTVLELTSDCWGCGDLDAPCIVSLEPRLTDDLPPGGELRVSPRLHPTACDVDCPAICEPHTTECQVPPLEPGHFYRVWVDGEVFVSFTAGEDARTCGAPTTGPVPG